MLIKSPLLFYLTWMLQIGSFFMINLCLVVIATQFSETKRRETAKMKAERARFRSSSTLSSFTNSETTNCYREIIKLIAHLIRKAVKRTKATYRSAQQTTLKEPIHVFQTHNIYSMHIFSEGLLDPCHP